MNEMDWRHYDPALGRWVATDPIVHFSTSPYSAFENNPVFWTDPSGLSGVPSYIAAMWNATPNGTNSYWSNNHDGSFTSYDISVTVDLNGNTFDFSQSLDEMFITIYRGKGGGGSLPDNFAILVEDHLYKHSDVHQYLKRIDNAATAVGVGIATQEGALEMAEKLAEGTDNFGNSASKLLKATKVIGAIGGLVSAGTAIYDAYQRPTSGNIAKAVGNSALAILKINPIIGIATGIMDATGLSDKIYDSIGNYVNDNMNVIK